MVSYRHHYELMTCSGRSNRPDQGRTLLVLYLMNAIISVTYVVLSITLFCMCIDRMIDTVLNVSILPFASVRFFDGVCHAADP